NPDAAAHLARALVKTAAFDEARSTLDVAIRHHPGDSPLYFERGKLLASMEHREAALRDLKTAIQLNPKAAEFYVEMSKVLHAMGKPEEQRAALETAVRLDPNLVEARYALANLARQQGDAAASREQFTKVQQIKGADVN